MRRDLLTELCEVAGPSGREERVRELVLPELESVCNRVTTDPLGGLTGVRDGSGGPRLMLAAHMDEIGLMVTHVDDRGYLRFVPLGGWDARTLVGQRVMVHGRDDLPGIVGTTPVHLLDEAARQKAPKLEDLAVDTGLPAERVRALVRQGDVITRTRTLEGLGDLVTGKSLDDRVGLFVMLEAMHVAGPSPSPGLPPEVRHRLTPLPTPRRIMRRAMASFRSVSPRSRPVSRRSDRDS